MLMMKIFSGACIFLFALTFSGCSVAGDIFKTGVWLGVIIVAALIVLIIFLVRKGIDI